MTGTNTQDQFTTLEEAQAIREQINTHPEIGGGIKEYNPDKVFEYPGSVPGPDASGIFVPVYGGPPPTPHEGKSLMYQFRFNNGFDDYNAGLCQQMIKNSPEKWPQQMAAEVNKPQL